MGPNTTVTAGPGSSEEDSDVYNIKFTFLATPLAKQAPLKPTEGVTRITGGQLGDDGVNNRATEAFTELVARLYFNVLTAALGSDCDPGCGFASSFDSFLAYSCHLTFLLLSGSHRALPTLCSAALEGSEFVKQRESSALCRYPELAPAAKLMQTRLRRLMPGNSSYHGMPLTETLLSDKNGSLCIQEANTLYQVILLHSMLRAKVLPIIPITVACVVDML